MPQSGTTGFMASNVTNLDGKVNYAALMSWKRGTMGSYLRTNNFQYIADLGDRTNPEDDISALLLVAEKAGLHYRAVEKVEDITIYKQE